MENIFHILFWIVGLAFILTILVALAAPSIGANLNVKNIITMCVIAETAILLILILAL